MPSLRTPPKSPQVRTSKPLLLISQLSRVRLRLWCREFIARRPPLPGKKRDSSGGGGSIPVVSPVKGVSKNKKKKKSGSAATGSGKGKDKAATEEGADGEDKEQSLRSALSEKMGALLGDDLEDDPAKMQRVLEAFSEDNESEVSLGRISRGQTDREHIQKLVASILWPQRFPRPYSAA